MNTLKIIKSTDALIKLNGEELCFVKKFCAKETVDVYKIVEMLSEDIVDFLKLKTGYVLEIEALSHLDSSVFENEPFEITVDDTRVKYRYKGCRLIKKERDINSSKPITDRYTIAALKLETMEGQDE